jgi:hypothetical protein
MWQFFHRNGGGTLVQTLEFVKVTWKAFDRNLLVGLALGIRFARLLLHAKPGILAAHEGLDRADDRRRYAIKFRFLRHPGRL